MKSGVAILLINVAFHLSGTVTACPTECNCFGFNGEWIADCARRGLTSVSYADFDSTTTEIHLQYNMLENLDESTFANVPKLKHLYLQSNRISSLAEKIFDNLPDLETLRLNSNQITNIGTFKFQNLKSLKLLYVHNNDLREVGEDAFAGLESVEQISVAGNPHLATIHIDAFHLLPGLTMVDMSGTALTTLEPRLVSRIDNLTKVYTYDIDTLICDDALQRYLTWMLTKPLTAFGRATMVCGQPENLKGRSVTVVDPDRHYTNAGDCPSECSCFSSGDAHIADCSSRGLEVVPAGFAPETTEIFLQNNGLTRLVAYDFLHLTKLQYLYLHNNNLSVVDLNAFTGAAGSLKQLTLNDNEIGAIAGVFSGMESLEILNLNHNQLTRIRPTDLSSMVNLAQFSANHNSLRMVMAGSFDRMASLKYLGLAINNLDELPQDLLVNCPNLYFVDISGNSFVSLPNITASVSVFEARDSGILSLTPSSFENAISLQTLDLSNNKIYAIEENTFMRAINVQTIYLDHNNMESVMDSHFESLRNLVVLDLSNNARLASVTDNAFIRQRDSLQRLYLDNCAFSTMNGKAISILQHPNFRATLEGNPWNCDCKLQDFSSLLSSSPGTFDQPTCQEPKSKEGDLVTDVNYEELCAQPPVTEPVNPVPPKDEKSALVISLTTVLAVLVFAVVMIVVVKSSKSAAKAHAMARSQDDATYVNGEYRDEEKNAGAQL